MALALPSRSSLEPGYFLARSAADLARTAASPFNVGLWPRALSAATARRFAEVAATTPLDPSAPPRLLLRLDSVESPR